MSDKKTHREVKNPQISARFLAEYMAASELRSRTIVRDAKYQSKARVIQHDEAKLAVSKFVREGGEDITILEAAADALRNRLFDNDFEQDHADFNADYISRFAEVFPEVKFPDAEILPGGPPQALPLNGVKVTTEIHWRLRRTTKTNKVRVGAATLRYAKGKALSSEVAAWQSAFLFGYLQAVGVEDGAEPERKLCLTVDAQSGLVHSAPGNSIQRFKNMEAACASIAERWPNVPPPNGAVL